MWRQEHAPPRAGLPEQALPIARGRPWLEAGSGPRRPCCHIWLNLVWTGGATGATRGRPTGGQVENLEIGRRKCAGFSNSAKADHGSNVPRRRACLWWPPHCSRTRWCCKQPASALLQIASGRPPRLLWCGTRCWRPKSPMLQTTGDDESDERREVTVGLSMRRGETASHVVPFVFTPPKVLPATALRYVVDRHCLHASLTERAAGAEWPERRRRDRARQRPRWRAG